MQTIPASEIKRRGLAALEDKLDRGPVHVIKNNKLACVILSEAEYARLQQPEPPRPAMDIRALLLAHRAAPEDQRSREEIDAALNEDRSGWDRD